MRKTRKKEKILSECWAEGKKIPLFTGLWHPINRSFLLKQISFDGFGELRAEYANYHYDLLGLLTCNQHCILIRIQK